MAKRYGKDFDKFVSTPAKKAKVETFRQRIVPKERVQSAGGNAAESNIDDLWGEDFDDDAIEKMDLIVSQACSQDVNISVGTNTSDSSCKEIKATKNHRPMPSTSRGISNDILKKQVISKLKDQQRGLPTTSNANAVPTTSKMQSQKLGSSDEIRDIVDDECTMVFDDFKNNLLERNHFNSTFRLSNNVVVVPDDAQLRLLEKLKAENKKLLDDFMTKEGETVFLRSQLQQTQIRAEKEKIEKAHLIEKQASQFRAEINALYKEKENLKTQYDFQALQLGSLMERCKLLESGTVKLTQPQIANGTIDSVNRSRLDVRPAPATKSVKTVEISIQTSAIDKSSSDLKTCVHYHPLEIIPQSIFESSLPEKSVVDIQIVEKFGKKNLPILQEEDTFRIFENPDLVKPIVTMIDKRKLNVEYVLPDIAVIMKKSEAEINSKECVPIVNKIVATTKELLLNSTTVLKTISTAMKNDDIRDMNDLYFSDFYDKPINYNQSICDSNMWHEKERGIETRRALGTLSYIAEASNYLSELIAGKTKLNIENDVNYNNYEKKLVRYNAWHKKGHDFEILEMMNEFVTALGFVRRSHQFSGLICAIARTLYSVQKRVGFNPEGLQYVSNIFKEIVFSRPLVLSFTFITKMMTVFCKSSAFGQKLCSSPKKSALKIWKDVLHFTPDACTLEIYIAQVERFRLDEITTINIAHELLSFVHQVFLSDSIPRTIEFSRSCNCRTRVLKFTITLLCNCSKIDLKETEIEALGNEQVSTKLNESFWRKVRRKQMNGLRKGIRFLSYLAKRDPDFIIRELDIGDSFTLFMQRIATFEGLRLHENEEEALALIRSTLTFEKPSTTKSQTHKSEEDFSITKSFKQKSDPTRSSGQWYDVSNTKNSSTSLIDIYKNVLSS